MAWPPWQHITRHRNVMYFIAHSSHCSAPHHNTSSCIASVLFVHVADISYGISSLCIASQRNATHRIASPWIRPRIASHVHDILPHRNAWPCLASHHIASPHFGIASLCTALHCITSHRIASHRIATHCPCIASPVHRILPYRIACRCHKQGQKCCSRAVERRTISQVFCTV